MYGDANLHVGVDASVPAVDIKKLLKVFGQQLFSVSFMIGPIPITFSLDLEVQLGLHFTVRETGAVPTATAHGTGHFRFGKSYTRSHGWKPVNVHTLDFGADSAGGSVKADLFIYANIIPKFTLHHIGSANVVITPAIDLSLTVALPVASCDYKPFVPHSATCTASEGTANGCAVSLSIVPSVNIAMTLDVDINLFSKSLYKKNFGPYQLWQKNFALSSFPKCLVMSWSKSTSHAASSSSTYAALPAPSTPAHCGLKSGSPASYQPFCATEKTSIGCAKLQLTCSWVPHKRVLVGSRAVAMGGSAVVKSDTERRPRHLTAECTICKWVMDKLVDKIAEHG